MNLQPEDVMRRMPNTLGLVREMRDLIEVILKRCTSHCMSGVELEEWDSINDQLVALVVGAVALCVYEVT